ncbi:glycosyltransferase [Xenococcus sp. PCC 7305]|uniref:glycosyltransferase family 4 protein n=1 Tax=Xenococcus sp. PCC 7305 TaxID=102125 RepID=UPI0002ACDAE8|nr:glycosyltransferase family 4 protein [Xenococcus sp. PCC 7305]ELS01853.1 glycosyltransferase [Xenococcus sp. PCC 7305]
MLNLLVAWNKKSKLNLLNRLRKRKNRVRPKQQKFCLSIITQFYPPDYAATGQLIQELATQLGDENVRVSVFTGQPGYAFSNSRAPRIEENQRVKVKRTRATQLLSKKILGKALNGIIFSVRAGLHIIRHRKNQDVLLLTTAPPFLFTVGYLANIFFKTPYVCLVYDLYPDVVTEFGLISSQNAIAKLWNWCNNRIWSRAQGIIVLSDTMKDRIVAKHPRTSSKIAVIHNWANADWIKPISKEQNWFAYEHGTHHKFTVLYSGNLGRCHDLETMLGTIKLLKDEEIRFVFIGAGVKHELCRQTVKEWGLRNCTFLPYQDRSYLPYSLTSCDLALVSIAPGMEGVVVPSKLYGVMAAGRAIAAICEPHSYLRSLIDDANCGACFNNGDSEGLAEFIRFLAKDPQTASKMGQSGRKHLEANFTPQIIAQQYQEILNPQTQSITISR